MLRLRSDPHYSRAFPQDALNKQDFPLLNSSATARCAWWRPKATPQSITRSWEPKSKTRARVPNCDRLRRDLKWESWPNSREDYHVPTTEVDASVRFYMWRARNHTARR